MAWSDTEIDRYSRHLLLEEVGWKGGERIRRGRVLLVDDVEPTTVRYLAAAGIARLSLVRPSGRLVAAAMEAEGEDDVEVLPPPLSAEQVRDHDAVVVGGDRRDVVVAAWHASHPPVVVAVTTPLEVAITTLVGDDGCPACVDLPPHRPPAGPLAPPLHGIAGTLVATEILKLLAGVAPSLTDTLLVAATNGRIELRPRARRMPCAACGG